MQFQLYRQRFNFTRTFNFLTIRTFNFLTIRDSFETGQMNTTLVSK